LRPRVVLLLCVAAGLAVATGLGTAPSFAAAGDFAPRSWQNGAYFDLFGSYEMDDNRASAQPFRWDDTFFREKLTLFSDGYVYDPRFLQYHGSLSGALKQEYYEASYLDPQGWTHDTGVEYEARLFFLSEHPYNVELFALRYEPLFKEQASTQHNSIETSRGIFFQYRRRPWLGHAKYSVDALDNGFSTTTITRLGLDGEYFKHYSNGNLLSFTGAYNPSRTTTTEDLTSHTSEYLLGNVIDVKKLRLNSSVTRTNRDQDSPLSGEYTNDQSSWYEMLNAYFPWHLRSNVSYRRQNNDSTFPDPLLGERELTDDSHDFQVDLIHRLYESLDTTLSYLDSDRRSSSGETRWNAENLNLNYTKSIPRGRVLAGTNLGRAHTTSEGITDIVAEPHLANAVPGFFDLGQPNVEPGSVAIFLKSPLAPFNNIQLVENLHYTLALVGNTTEVTILTLPPLFAVPGTFDFLASYSLATGDYELDSRTFAFNGSVDLFDNMWTPYYSYVAIRSDVTQGVFPGTPLDSTTNTLGLRYLNGPWRARGEYQDLDWEVSPYHAWRGEVQYVGPINPTTNIYGTAQYLHKYYPQGTSQGQLEPYNEETSSVSGNVRKDVPSQGLAFSVGATLSRTVGRVDTDAYSLNSSLSWRIGKINLTAGATAYGSATSGSDSVESDRFHQYFYLMLRRFLF
jgi:hypothetical protein